MKFELPVASRQRLDELLEYLGDRAEDFKKCFDVESEWCWKYADLVLRGIMPRTLSYAEEHHVVPVSFYGKRRNKAIDLYNVTTLTFQEHLYSHFCLAKCSIGNMKGKMSCAFDYMYNIGMHTDKMPSEAEVLDYISSQDLHAIKMEIPVIKQVTEDGRHHKWEVPLDEYNKEIYNSRRDKKSSTNKALYRRTKSKRKRYNKKYYAEHKVEILAKNKEYYAANKEHINAQNRQYHADHRDELNQNSRDYYAEHADHLREYAREYGAEHREERRIKEQQRRSANRQEYNANARQRYKDNADTIKARQQAFAAAKKAAGYRYRKDPITGKHRWVFVGITEQDAA